MNDIIYDPKEIYFCQLCKCKLLKPKFKKRYSNKIYLKCSRNMDHFEIVFYNNVFSYCAVNIEKLNLYIYQNQSTLYTLNNSINAIQINRQFFDPFKDQIIGEAVIANKIKTYLTFQ